MSSNINESKNEKKTKFEVDSRDLLSFCDCLSLIRNKIGLVAWDDEDFLTLFEEGTTMFYTVTEKSITSAIEVLKLKIKNPEVVVDYALLIVVCSSKQQDLAYKAFEILSKCIPNRDFWFQLFPLKEALANDNDTLMDKNIAVNSNDDFIKNNDITLYLLTNKRLKNEI